MRNQRVTSYEKFRSLKRSQNKYISEPGPDQNVGSNKESHANNLAQLKKKPSLAPICMGKNRQTRWLKNITKI